MLLASPQLHLFVASTALAGKQRYNRLLGCHFTRCERRHQNVVQGLLDPSDVLGRN